jgi:XTP/dITP diphosphohydrolase
VISEGPSSRAVSGNGAGRQLTVVLATANEDKAAEIVQILQTTARGRIEVLARPSDAPEVEESGETLEENARLKARALLAHTGMPAVADDTGLEVEALGGAPGVRSSRFSGLHATYDENVAKLLFELDAVGATRSEQRHARFRTVALACFPDGHEVVAEGVVEGTISSDRRGESGFGYDPVFVPLGQSRTFAEMTAQDKNTVSHRGRAFRALAVGLLSEISGP